MKKTFLTIAIMLSMFARAEEENKAEFSVNADFVSSYVWRGMYCGGASIQPAMDFTVGGFSIGAWGSVSIADNFITSYKEIDLYASYSFGNLTAGLYNFWVNAEGEYNYFDFSESTCHQLEANLLYSFGFFPLSLGWNTLIAGNDFYFDKNGKSKRAFSTYIEAIYDFSIKEVDLQLSLGVSPWKSNVLYINDLDDNKNNDFALINTSLSAIKSIKITENYSLGLFGQLVVNPAKQDIFLVFGISF